MNNALHLKIWRGIRHCNIFLENMKDLNNVPDISLSERERWIGEVEFLKAYYHYYMLRMYGPIPIVDQSYGLDVEDQMQKRMPVDDCVNYISNLLDVAIPKLPPRIVEENTQLGRITQPIAYAVKAKLLVMAASPLFNGNPDYATFKDKDGVLLFNPVYDPNKWVKARDAAKEAIDKAEEQGFKLYQYTVDPLNLSAETKTQLSIRNAVTQRWGDEHVWALSNSYMNNEFMGMPPTERGTNSNRGQLRGLWAAPLKIAKMFYTKNGVPIEEDATLNFGNYLEVRRATAAERFNIEPNY